MDVETLLVTGIANSRARERVTRCCCRVVEGRDAGQQVFLGVKPIVVGADGSCDLTLRDPAVSRRHLKLTLTGEGIQLEDLQSTNGTYWMGSRVQRVLVPLGASVHIGATVLRLSRVETQAIPPSTRTQFGGLVGQSLAMREVFAVLELASSAEVSILIEGESGTGKECAARAIHDHSPRAGGPFVVFDCAAVNEQLADSQLFGHRRGAFTGAVSDRPGAFVSAKGGTLFIDELGELPLTVQSKLLRALEQREVLPVGSDRPVPVDVRVVAATHRDLARMVAEGRFRFDLYHRLAVVHIALPPLRERLEDIPAMIGHFYTSRGRHPPDCTGENMRRLQSHSWPGNARELRNVLERAWAMSGAEGDKEEFSHLRLWISPTESTAAAPLAVDLSLPFKEAKERQLERFEQAYLEGLFNACGRNIARTARHAELSRRHLRELLRKHGLVAEARELEELEPDD